MAAWSISGDYMETCNCELVCPCVTSSMTAPPTEGDCKAAVTLRIDSGSKDGVALDGLSFIVMLHSPGPMAALAPLVGRFAGIEKRPIVYTANGLNREVRAAELVDQACEGLPSPVAPGEAITIDNVAHPVNTRVALAKATRSRFNVFGITWDDATGTRNGHFSPFAWSA